MGNLWKFPQQICEMIRAVANMIWQQFVGRIGIYQFRLWKVKTTATDDFRAMELFCMILHYWINDM
jgi:hypothetical protein